MKNAGGMACILLTASLSLNCITFTYIFIYMRVCILEVDQVKEKLTDIADGNKSCVDTAMEKVK